MWPAKIELKENDLGKPLGFLHHIGWLWFFFITVKPTNKENTTEADDDKSDLLTAKSSLLPVLVAVTPKQQKSWAKQGIKYKHNWAWVNSIITKIHETMGQIIKP